MLPQYPLGCCQKTTSFHSDSDWSGQILKFRQEERGDLYLPGLWTILRRLIPSLQTETFLEFSGHFSRPGSPAASTRVGKMSTNSTRDSENTDWMMMVVR